MSSKWTRRSVLFGLGTSAAIPAFGQEPMVVLRPVPRPERPAPIVPGRYDDLIQKASLGNAKVGFIVVDARTGAVLDAHQADQALPPASVAKAVTALYALEMLGPDFRFSTRVVALGPVVNGRLEGDLALIGGADPTLTSDQLGALAEQIKDAGIIEVTGEFLVFAGALPTVRAIDRAQPEHLGYNPAISGLNLNFNRVHFEWKRAQGNYDITMQARAVRYSPGVHSARMQIVDRSFPVFDYTDGRDHDRWSVAKGALGNEGARWLPVRYPEIYAGEVFQTIMRSHGIVLRGATIHHDAAPEGIVLAEIRSKPLQDILQGMLKHSTNLTAEVVGMMASAKRAGTPKNLIGSAVQMNQWLKDKYGIEAAGFVDHSGLGGAARVSARTLATVMVEAGPEGPLAPILKQINAKIVPGQLRAKTGTLNFVSGLAGYYKTPQGRDLAFAVVCADVGRRIRLRREEMERPRGARSWSRRARHLQYQLIEKWSEQYGV